MRIVARVTLVIAVLCVLLYFDVRMLHELADEYRASIVRETVEALKDAR